MDGCLQAGAVKEDVGEVDRLFQPQVNGAGRTFGAGACEQAGETGVDGAEAGFVEPMGESITGAFGEGSDSINATDQEEPLQEMALGDAHAKLTVIGSEEVAGDVAAQGEDGSTGEFVDLLRGARGGIKSVLLYREGDEFGFQPGDGQDFIDADEQIALLVIIPTGGNKRKRWTKLGLVGYDFHGSMAAKLVW